jgi:RNA polymerase sigma factor (sigma-70 family)
MRNLDWRRLRTDSRTDYEADSEGYPRSDFKEWPEISTTALDRPEIREELVKALQSLALENREVFVAHDVHGLSLKETCAVLGLSAATVRARLRRARFSLREILARNLRPPGSSQPHQNLQGPQCPATRSAVTGHDVLKRCVA